MSSAPEPRKGMPSPDLSREEFTRRFLSAYVDPAFDPLRQELDRVAATAWDGYANGRKAPVTRKAGPGYADPDYDLSVDWIAAADAIEAARARHADPAGPTRFLIVNGSPRSEHSCPGEMSKSWRLVEIAREVLAGTGRQVEVLDLSRLTSEYGRQIHPCKACFSTAAALCHFPCSCYPNYAEGQVHDWMNEIYPLWIEAHGVMVISPVHWYQATSALKLMIDRLVCGDGGNPDPSRTHGKDAQRAKQIELDGYEYPRHLKGRLFSVIVHGDVEGAENVRRSLSDWMRFSHMIPAGPMAEVDRYIGYWEPYATSHEALDRNAAIQEEVRNAARALLESTQAKRDGKLVTGGENLDEPVPK